MNTLDDRLSRTFRAIDVAADFDKRLLARVHALSRDSRENQAQRADAARRWARGSYEQARKELRLWRWVAFRTLTLDSVAGATLIIVLLLALLRVAPGLGVYGLSLVVSALAVGVAAFCVIQVLLPSARTVARFRR